MAKAFRRSPEEIVRSIALMRAPKVQDRNSRTADKINVRLPDGVRDQIIEKCRAEHIAMNTYVVQALEEKLARDAGQPLVLEHISEQLAAIAAHLKIPTDERAAALQPPATDWET